MNVASRIAEARQSRGLTQRAVAHALNVSVQAVSQWETGKSGPKGQRQRQLAELLDVNPRWLAGDEGAPRRIDAQTGAVSNSAVPVISLEKMPFYLSQTGDARASSIKGYIYPTFKNHGKQFAIELPFDDYPIKGYRKGELIVFDDALPVMRGALVCVMKIITPKLLPDLRRGENVVPYRMHIGIELYRTEADCLSEPKQLSLPLDKSSPETVTNTTVLGASVERRQFHRFVHPELGRWEPSWDHSFRP